MSKVFKWSFYDVENDKKWLGDLHLSVPLPTVGEIIELGSKKYMILSLSNGITPGSTHCYVKKA